MNDALLKILAFRDARDWRQFHTPRNLAISLVLEAAETLEVFQWKRDNDYSEADREKLKEELADVMYYLLLLAHTVDVDLEEALEAKLKINEERYPVEKSKGRSTKYTQLD